MRVFELIEMLQKCDPNDVVETYDGDMECCEPVTGLTYGGVDHIVTLYTDDNEG